MDGLDASSEAFKKQRQEINEFWKKEMRGMGQRLNNMYDYDVLNVLNMSEEEGRKREQERNAQETKERNAQETGEREDEEKEERIKTVLTEEEQQEYIRLRNIKVMGEVMGKELSEEQKQRLEEFEIKLRGNDDNNAGKEDTNGGEVLQENKGKKPSLIEDIKDIQGKPVFIGRKGGKLSAFGGREEIGQIQDIG